MKKLFRFAKRYKLFAGAFLGAAVALGLDLGGLHTAAHWLLIAICALELLPLVWGMLQDVRMGTYGVDILAAVAILASVLMKEYWAGTVIVLMLTGGEALEDYAEGRAKKELDALLNRAPQKAHVMRGRKLIDLPVKEVNVGDKVVIRPGEIVPVDAAIVEGVASFDESSLTGESLPEVKKSGAQILSGSVNLDGLVTVKAIHSAADSQYEQIIKLVQAASKSQTPFVRLADRYSIPFTIFALGLGAAMWAITGQSIRFLEVLVVATPCPLILAAPIAIISGMSRAAKHGIIIKTGAALERLAETKTFAFDKTGTLTKGELTVDSVKVFGDNKTDEVLALAASLEKHSNHVLAQAIVQKAEAGSYKIPKSVHLQELAGNGLTATVRGRHVLVGRLGLLADYDIVMPKEFRAEDFQQTAAFVGIDGRLAGVITFCDEIREESKSTLAKLRDQGVKSFLMVTGDNKATAKFIAQKLGISNVKAEALPGDKIHAVEAATEKPVTFVGDGVNDAPVLTASDTGIALGARGSTAASESADIVILQDDLSYVARAHEIAQRTFSIANQSILIGIGLSVGLMFIFSTGKFRPIYGALVQEVVDVIVIFNALRAHGGKRK